MATDAFSIPLEDIDLSNPEIYGNNSQFEYFKRLREEDPVHLYQHPMYGPFWSVTSFDDIKFVDSNHALFSSQTGGTSIADPESRALDADAFIIMDPPSHTEKRKSVAPSVAPSNLANLEPLIRERVIDILDNLPTDEPFDWVDRVSIELTSRMLATLFGYPLEQRRQLVYWSDVAVNTPEAMGDEGIPDDVRFEEMGKMMQAFSELWMQRAAEEPGHDFISMMAHNEATKDMLNNPAEFMGTLMLLIVGGNDTTRNSISGGLLALNQFPDQYELLNQRPELIPNMVSEMIRWHTPVIHFRRTATEDVEIGGKLIKDGEKVVMWYLSGNRDESVFNNADDFNIERKNARQHLSFGYGVHRCMGNRMAELQLRVLWEEIQQRFAKIEVIGPEERTASNFIRGITKLPVRAHAL